MKNSMTLDRNLGSRYFTKDDGYVYETVATGVLDASGKMTYEDRLVSQSSIDARAALTLTEYKKVDSVVTQTATGENRFCAWLRSLTANVEKFDGLSWKTYWYNIRTGNTASRMTMDLEDDAPGTAINVEEDGVPLPIEFADWTSNIRRDPTASASVGYDVNAVKASFAAESVATGLDLRQINGWDGLKHRGMTVYGFRDVPTTLQVAQSGTIAAKGWLSAAVTPANIYADVKSMIALLTAAKIPGPYVLQLPESFRFRLAETFSTATDGTEKSLWMKLLERPSPAIPNVLNISQIKLVSEMDELKGGSAPINGEAYVYSIDPRFFRVLDYLPMRSFTIALKGEIATKHRVAEGICPLFKKNAAGLYGIAKLIAPTTAS